MNRFPVNRVKSNSLFAAPESDNKFMEVRNLAVRYGNAVTDTC
jgi:hypothetical protein